MKYATTGQVTVVTFFVLDNLHFNTSQHSHNKVPIANSLVTLVGIVRSVAAQRQRVIHQGMMNQPQF